MALKKCVPVQKTKSGIIFDIDSDAMNNRWMRNIADMEKAQGGDKKALTRLQKEENAPLYTNE